MHTDLTPTSVCISAFAWPSAEELQRLVAGPAAVREVLGRILQDTLRFFGADYGRLILLADAGVPHHEQFTCCASAHGPVAPITEADGPEQQALTRRVALHFAAPNLPAYFPDHLNLPPATQVLVAPISLEEQPVGVLSLGYCEGASLGRGDLRALLMHCEQFGRLLAFKAGRPDAFSTSAAIIAHFRTHAWPLILVDGCERIVSINDVGERLLQRTRDEIIDLPLSEVLQITDEVPVPTQGGVAYLCLPNGARTLVEFNRSSMALFGGRPITIIGLRDLAHAQMLIEERLKNAELAGIFRTIATVNHEINNPLFGLMATVQLLQHELTDAPGTVQTKLSRVTQCCERIRQITDNLSRVIRPARRTYAADEGMLDLSRATGGRHTTIGSQDAH